MSVFSHNGQRGCLGEDIWLVHVMSVARSAYGMLVVVAVLSLKVKLGSLYVNVAVSRLPGNPSRMIYLRARLNKARQGCELTTTKVKA